MIVLIQIMNFIKNKCTYGGTQICIVPSVKPFTFNNMKQIKK